MTFAPSRNLVSIACVLFFLGESGDMGLFAQNPSRDRVKQLIDFDNLPGKSGMLKPGLSFKQSDYPELAGFKPQDDFKHYAATNTERSGRLILLTKDKEEIIVRIVPSQVSTDDAQEAMVDEFLNYEIPKEEITKRGDLAGINVGDFNFVPQRDTLPGGVSQLIFVRNNIMVVLRRRNTTFDLTVLGRDIDDKIKAQVDHNQQQLAGKLPIISAFSPVQPSIRVFGRTAMNFQVTDPQGLALKFQFRSTRQGAVRRDEAAQPPQTMFGSIGPTGVADVSVTALNDALLFQIATTTVTVTP